MSFDHEKLRVYQEAVGFVRWVHGILEKVPKGVAVRSHLDEASSSVVLNIAEGNGKFTARDRCRFFDISRGSALECAGCLDVLVAKAVLSEEEVAPGKKILANVVSMLVGLIKSTSPSRVYEEVTAYESVAEDDNGDYD